MKFVTALLSFFFIAVAVVKAQSKDCESIVDIAVGNDDFSTLVAALTAADLVETLSGDGPFTVFAPTNDAFEKLDEETLASLLLPENIDDLTDILLYHVVPGKVLSKDLKEDTRVKTVQGTTVRVRTEPVIKINRSEVITADIIACNGVIHAIDTVLIPAVKNPPPAPVRPVAPPVRPPVKPPVPPPTQKPRIKNIGQCSSKKLCNICEGDCDKDSECKGDLVCFKRRKGSFKDVPGCRGGKSDKSGTDYCVDPDEL